MCVCVRGRERGKEGKRERPKREGKTKERGGGRHERGDGRKQEEGKAGRTVGGEPSSHRGLLRVYMSLTMAALRPLWVTAARQRVHQHVPPPPSLEDEWVLRRVIEDCSASRARG